MVVVWFRLDWQWAEKGNHQQTFKKKGKPFKRSPPKRPAVGVHGITVVKGNDIFIY